MNTEETEMTVWITKYALTQGIFSGKARICNTGSSSEKTGNMIALVGECNWGGERYFHGHGKDWTDSYRDALKIADKMRWKKVDSLKKQIKKLESMTFEKEVEKE
jgi:hypothetical protein